jgi:hypothetical protein
VAINLRTKHNVVREIEPWRALGPNGLEVVAFIEAVNGVDSKTMRKVGAARDAALCARDLITEDQFAILYTPWADVIDVATLGPWETLADRHNCCVNAKVLHDWVQVLHPRQK